MIDTNRRGKIRYTEEFLIDAGLLLYSNFVPYKLKWSKQCEWYEAEGISMSFRAINQGDLIPLYIAKITSALNNSADPSLGKSYMITFTEQST